MRCCLQAAKRQDFLPPRTLYASTSGSRINGEDVSDEQFLDAFLKVEKAAKEYEAEGEGHPSYFETLFLMGMLIFKEAGVEYLVMETGLGGRLDATNVVEKPLACIITSISRDHTEYLGDTLEAIAGRKPASSKPVSR